MKKILLFGLSVFVFYLSSYSYAGYEGFGLFSGILLNEFGIETGHLYMSVVAGSGDYFFIRIHNPTAQDMTGKIMLFDQTVTDEGENNIACFYNDATSSFASSMVWDQNSFVVPAYSGIVQIISLHHNYCFDGTSLGCVVVTEAQDRGLGDINVVLGVPNFVDLLVSRDDINCSKYMVKGIPSFRFSDFYLSGFISYWIADDIGSITVGNANASGTLLLSDEGVGQFVYPFPNHGSGYMVVYKPKSYLSVGYTGIFDLSSSGSLDFTHRVNLDEGIYSSGRYDKVYMTDLPESQGFSGYKSLLVAGDVNGNDYIGASDLALINSHLTVNFGQVDATYDFDRNGYITSKDQVILVQNVQRNGFRRHAKDALLSGLLTGDDVAAGEGDFPRIN